MGSVLPPRMIARWNEVSGQYHVSVTDPKLCDALQDPLYTQRQVFRAAVHVAGLTEDGMIDLQMPSGKVLHARAVRPRGVSPTAKAA